MYIEITGAPKQQAGEPDEVRKASVGAVFPVDELVEGIFSVKAEEGIEVLAFHSPEGEKAAEWWRKSGIIERGGVLVFSWLCCEVVPAPEYKRVPSIP